MTVTVSAPGKIILMGEHAVVYGKPAFISTINHRLTVSISPSKKLTIHADEGTDYIQHILAIVCKHFDIPDIPSLHITIHSTIPIGYHVGSSAALATALVGAVTYHMKNIWNPTLINQLAYESEKLVHTNSSGVDPAAVVSGGLIWYRKELEFLRSIWQLPFTIPKTLNHFFLIDTGRPKETTGEMVVYVKSKVKNQKSKMESLMNQNEEQTKRVVKSIKEENEKELIDAIHVGQRTLEGMGVVSNKIIPLIRIIEKAGGAVKILGGGGRKDGVGFLLCYHHEQKEIKALCQPYGYSLQTITLGGDGVKLESK